MKKYKFLPPYTKDGKTTFRATNGRAGVYLIKEDTKLVYIGMSGGNLYKTLYRHFETWTHKAQEVTTYAGRLKRHKYTVRVVLCTAAQAEALERSLIIKHKPRDNDLKYKGYQLKISDIKVLHEYSTQLTDAEMPF